MPGSERTLETDDVPCKLDDGDLEAKTDAEEGHSLLASPLRREHHALGSAHAETAWDEDAAAK